MKNSLTHDVCNVERTVTIPGMRLGTGTATVVDLAQRGLYGDGSYRFRGQMDRRWPCVPVLNDGEDDGWLLCWNTRGQQWLSVGGRRTVAGSYDDDVGLASRVECDVTGSTALTMDIWSKQIQIHVADVPIVSCGFRRFITFNSHVPVHWSPRGGSSAHARNGQNGIALLCSIGLQQPTSAYRGREPL